MSKGSPNVRRLRIKVSEVFKAFQLNSTWDFMQHPVQQIAYKCCIHLPKLNFRTEYSA